MDVIGYEVRLTAANDDDLGRWGERGEGRGSDGGCKGTEVLLTILCMLVSVIENPEKREVAGRAYATEEMPYKNYQNPAGSILIIGI